MTSFIEAPENRCLPDLLLPKLLQAMKALSRLEAAKVAAHVAMGALRSFASAFKTNVGEMGFSVDPEPGMADSGNLEYDLSDLFLRLGEAARAAGKGWVLLIDEVQYLEEKEYGALIVSLHRATLKNLPVLFFGAGLPQVAALSGEAKSYAERLFTYPNVGPLDHASAVLALRHPIEDEGKEISDAALDEIYAQTKGYPYFLQE